MTLPTKEERVLALRSIYFYLTEGCNLRCRHCWISPKYQNENQACAALDFDLFGSIIAQARCLGLRAAKLTGGEPLIHPRIHDIIELIRTENLRLIVETNGILCTPNLSREMAACKSPFVSVSLDGSDAETHEWMRGVSGCFEKALEGIRNLTGAGLKPQIIMSVIRRNKNQIEQVVRMTESLGCGSIKLNIVQPTARGEQMHDQGETLTIEELIELGQWVERDLAPTTSLRLSHSHPLAFRPLGRMFGDNGCGCNTCGILSIIGVLADGSYALCGIGEMIPELVYGHAAKDRLEDVWKNSPVLKELRKGLPNRLEGICAHCALKGVCLGHCVAQNYYSTGTLWSAYWYCDQAHSKGLFPDGRLLSKSVFEEAVG